MADQLSPAKDNIESIEGNSEKLKCSYETSSENVRLYWYRQYPNMAPEFLLYKGARSISYENIPDSRFGTTTTRTSTELHITKLTLADSAIYYCALRVGAQ